MSNHVETKDPDTTLGIKISSKQKAAIEMVYRFGVFFLLMLNLFLKTQYVSQADYKLDRDADKKIRDSMESAIIELKTLVAVMETKNEINGRQDLQIQDHESRLRALEIGKKK